MSAISRTAGPSRPTAADNDTVGIKYYVFWRCMRRDVMMNDFIWEGLDGTRINTHWLPRGYSGISFPTQPRC